ncbi:hypothetical protein N1851_025678 [Merluccius polli]|uniref:Uncharacterized protein n=1 Tax=Merluccius polli TaxID=89951 RepID=A0AA47MD87_MERPO|nr:hypothetical protein N1851_025678 [Merluccius polli]
MSVFIPERVKELREQGGVRGGGLKTKGTFLSKPNLTRTSSSNAGSTNSRDKSSQKRPKLNHRDAHGPNTPPKRLPVAGATLGSTPKNSPWEEGRHIRGREEETGIEHLTPVRSHGPDTPSQGQPTAGGILCSTPKNSIRDRGSGYKDRVVKQDIGIEHLTPVKCPAEWSDGEQRERRPGRWGGSEDGDRRNPEEGNDRKECINRIHPNRVTRQLDSQRAGLEERRDNSLKTGGREEEERHLRWYHQQLQQFTPLAALQSAHPSESSSSVRSISSSSNPPTVSAASSSSSPKLALSPVVYHGLQELLAVYRAGIEIQTGVDGGQPDHGSSNVAAPIQTSSVKFLERSKSTWTTDDADGAKGLRAHCGLLTKQQETADVEVSYEREVGESRDVADGGEGREMEWVGEEGQRRWAWVTTTPTEETEKASSPLLTQEELVISSTDPGDHQRQTHLTSSSGLMFEEEYNDDDWIERRHGYRDSNRPFHQHQPSCPRQDPPQHLAPAERPLSPACEPTDHHSTGIQLGHLSLESKENNTSSNIVPPLRSLYPPQGVPLVITSERESGRTDFAVKLEIPNSLWSRPQYRPPLATRSRNEVSSSVFNRCREQPAFVQSAFESPPNSDVRTCSVVKTCDSSPDESSVGSLPGMDPLSLSQLEVSRQAASESFLCGEMNNISPCLLDHTEAVDGSADLLWEMSK